MRPVINLICRIKIPVFNCVHINATFTLIYYIVDSKGMRELKPVLW